MIRCGENSLAMYCFSVLLSFMGFVILTQFSSGFAMQAAVSIAGIALMIAAANLLAWESRLDRPWPKLF
jgi:drug/metabolite transporter (DMT)-like permease